MMKMIGNPDSLIALVSTLTPLGRDASKGSLGFIQLPIELIVQDFLSVFVYDRKRNIYI